MFISQFAKDGRYIEEKKLRVILVSPPNSPIHSPVNGTAKQVYDVPTPEEQHLNDTGNFSPLQTVSNIIINSNHQYIDFEKSFNVIHILIL